MSELPEEYIKAKTKLSIEHWEVNSKLPIVRQMFELGADFGYQYRDKDIQRAWDEKDYWCKQNRISENNYGESISRERILVDALKDLLADTVRLDKNTFTGLRPPDAQKWHKYNTLVKELGGKGGKI